MPFKNCILNKMERNAFLDLKSKIETINIEKSKLKGDIEMKREQLRQMETQIKTLMERRNRLRSSVQMRESAKKDYETFLKKSRESYKKMVDNCHELTVFLDQQMASQAAVHF